MKGNSKESFDTVVSEVINNREKRFRKFKSKIPLDQKNYKKARYKVKKLISKKKRNYFETKLSENICKPEELSKTITSLNKVFIAMINTFKDDKVVKYDSKSISETFQMFFANMPEILLQKFPAPSNKYGIDSVNKFYKDLDLTTKFQLKPTIEDIVLKLLKTFEISQAASIDNLLGRFLEDCAVIFANPVTKICNLSTKSETFPDPCKVAKLKPIFKKGSRMELLLL